ncbi:MAG: hypothetical protein J6Y54_07285 [Lentisphaeria bacterium]|nr:hypothetical protein [Lentisphaeria bacterium]
MEKAPAPTEKKDAAALRPARPVKVDRERIAVWGLLLAGVALRLWYLWDFSGSPLFDLAIGPDVREYYQRAQEIGGGCFFPVVPDIHAPLYSCFLALMLKLGAAIPTVRAVQLVLNFGALVSFYLLLRKKRTPAKWRLAFLGVVMLMPVPVYYQSELISESLLVPLGAAFFWLRHWAGRARTPGGRSAAFFGAGLALGAMNLTHPMTLLFSAAEVGWELFIRRDRRSAALLLAALAATVGTFCAARSAHYRKLCGIQANSGFNFYLGNNPSATGGCYLRPGQEWRKVHREAAAEARARGISSDAVFLRRAGNFWLRRPGRALLLWGVKACRVLSVRELPSGSDLPPILCFTSAVFYGRMLMPALLVLAAFGLWRIFRRREVRFVHYLLFFLALYLAQIATVTSGRYRMAMIVPAALFAAVGICDFNWRRYWALPVLATLVCGFLTITDYGKKRTEAALLYAEAALKRGDFRQTEELAAYASRAIDNPDPALVWELRSEAAAELSQLAIAEGRPDEAQRLRDLAAEFCAREIEAENTFYRGWMNYAMLAEKKGDRDPVWYDRADEWYREALKCEPAAPDLRYNYALFRCRTGRPCAAEIAAMLRAAPNWSQAWHLAGIVAMRERDFRRALECFHRAAELAPTRRLAS